MTDQKRKLLGPFEWFSLIIALGIIAYIILPKFGIHMVEQTESVEIIENPGHSRNAKQVGHDNRDLRNSEQEVDYMLRKVAEQFSDGKEHVRDINGLSKDETNYLNDVKKKYSYRDEIDSARDWFTVLKKSHDTYSKVKSIFGDDNRSTNFSSKIKDTEKAESIYDQLSNRFKISKEKAASFAEESKNDLSDWVEFVEENRKD